MKTLNVPGMHCAHCVARIDAALTAAGIAHEISLENKTVAVEENKIAQAVEAMDDLGFEAE